MNMQHPTTTLPIEKWGEALDLIPAHRELLPFAYSAGERIKVTSTEEDMDGCSGLVERRAHYPDEVDWESGPMYRVLLDDGRTSLLFEDELRLESGDMLPGQSYRLDGSAAEVGQ